MKFLMIVALLAVVQSCGIKQDSALTAKRVQKPAKERTYNLAEYKRMKANIGSMLVLSSAAAKIENSNLCVGPAIASWVDHIAGLAAKEGRDVPDQFIISDIRFYKNLGVVLIRDDAKLNYIVYTSGLGECIASEAKGPIEDKDLGGLGRSSVGN